MDRGKKAFYNSIASTCAQVVTMVCGFILPRLILSTFGSSYNGITASVSQFLSVIALLRAGIGGATRASLYKSLAYNDTKKISATVKATEVFMRKIALIFLGIVIMFSVFYPFLVKDEFEFCSISYTNHIFKYIYTVFLWYYLPDVVSGRSKTIHRCRN